MKVKELARLLDEYDPEWDILVTMHEYGYIQREEYFGYSDVDEVEGSAWLKVVYLHGEAS